jgi:hypothetical protein
MASSFPFHDAAQHGDVRRVRDLLLSSSPSIDAMNNVKDIFSSPSSLISLLVWPHCSDVGFLIWAPWDRRHPLENGADINFQDKVISSPLSPPPSPLMDLSFSLGRGDAQP